MNKTTLGVLACFVCLGAGCESGSASAASVSLGDAGTLGDGSTTVATPIHCTDRMDLLLVIDDSASMAEEQAALLAEIPSFVRRIASGDLDGDGNPDAMPVTSLHVGVVTSDMGLGEVAGVPQCAQGFGDDGAFRSASAEGNACGSGGGGWFDFEAGDDVAAFASAVTCAAAAGTHGCGFEEQLEAPLKALSIAPSADGGSPVSWTRAGYRPPTFREGSIGHGGDGASDGFLRADSILAVVVMTDEDDCSTEDTTMFDPADPDHAWSPLNLRCHDFASELTPTQRYVDGLLGLRADARRVVFEVIGGIPESLAGDDYDAMLTADVMQERVDTNGMELVPVCDGGSGRAYPARRLVDTARGIAAAGAHTSVQSICKTSFSGILDPLAQGLRECAAD